MSLVVMKFGGTSVEDPAAIDAHRGNCRRTPCTRQTAGCGGQRHGQGDRPVAARGNGRGSGRPHRRPRHQFAPALAHRDTACALIKDSAELGRLTLIDQKFDSLDEVLRGLAAILELTPRISDLVSSYGERISSRIVAAAFRERGIDAVHVDARNVIVTDSQFGRAVPQDNIIEKRAAEELCPLLDQKKVPVMGGFIASNEDGITTTLGRGGSDFTGALVGGAFNASALKSGPTSTAS